METKQFYGIVGVFYGYSFECNQTVLFGSHALRHLIDSKNLDFFSSPNAYTNNRSFGIDWADMIPVDSLKLHGKLCFMECDIRTYLTRAIQEVRIGEYSDDIYRTKDGASVWVGPPTLELAKEALRKCFAHQITKASAIWWFDMWGGWYRDPTLMSELKLMKDIYSKELTYNKSPIRPEVAFFADERAYANLFSGSPDLNGINATRTAMGNTGVPYDTYMAEDAPTVLAKYKAAIFVMPIPSEAGERAMELCKEMGIPYLSPSLNHYELSIDEIREFYKNCSIRFYTDKKDVVYMGQGYIGLHAAIAGKKVLKLPRPLSVSSVFGTNIEEQTIDTVCFEAGENTTALFKLQESTSSKPR